MAMEAAPASVIFWEAGREERECGDDEGMWDVGMGDGDDERERERERGKHASVPMTAVSVCFGARPVRESSPPV
jgi:hypothetical protein